MDPLQRLFVEVLYGAPPNADEPAELRAWLQRLGLAPADLDAVLASDLRGLFCYRHLTRQTLLGAFERALPITLARLGPLFLEDFERFLLERGTRTHFLRGVIHEFLEWAVPRWANHTARIPRYIVELARYEALRFELASLKEIDCETSTASLGLESRVRFSGTCRLAHYDFAVQLVSERSAEPEPTPTDLFVYRSAAHEVRCLAVSALAAAILERLLGGDMLGAAVSSACNAAGCAVDAAIIEGASEVLADLAERGALLGTY